MKSSHLAKYGVGMATLVAMLAGCSSSGPGLAPTGGGVPVLRHGRPAPDVAKTGLYVYESPDAEILGYAKSNRHNGGPICTIPEQGELHDVAVDNHGNVIAPSLTASGAQVFIFQGPAMCGAAAGRFADPYGVPIDAASANAITGTVIIGNAGQYDIPGNIAICTMSGGCPSYLTNSGIAFQLTGVALAKNGDCWADGRDVSYVTHLVYFAKCAGAGQVATGFVNKWFGGIDIDSKGNLVTIDSIANMAYVYSGCDPACSQVGSGQTLLTGGQSVYAHLNKKSSMYATADFNLGQIDIYKYRAGTLTYQYSFNNGLSVGGNSSVVGVAYNPRSKE